jgi:hypothetical protein
MLWECAEDRGQLSQVGNQVEAQGRKAKRRQSAEKNFWHGGGPNLYLCALNISLELGCQHALKGV